MVGSIFSSHQFVVYRGYISEIFSLFLIMKRSVGIAETILSSTHNIHLLFKDQILNCYFCTKSGNKSFLVIYIFVFTSVCPYY